MKRKRTSSLTTPFGRNTVALRIPVQGVSCRRRVVGGFEITTITPSSLQQYTQAKANIKEDKTRGIKAVSYSQKEVWTNATDGTMMMLKGNTELFKDVSHGR